MATVGVNILTCAGLLWVLASKLGGLPLANWAKDSLQLLLASVLGAMTAWGMAQAVDWPEGLLGALLQCGSSGGLGVVIFGLIASWAEVPEAKQMLVALSRRGGSKRN